MKKNTLFYQLCFCEMHKESYHFVIQSWLFNDKIN